MSLQTAIGRATRATRRHQRLAELRMDEQLLLEVARAQLVEEWSAADTLGDDRFVRLARAHYATLTTDEQRDTMAALFAEWSRDEAHEERILTNARDTNLQSLRTHHRNTPIFVDGAPAPAEALA